MDLLRVHRRRRCRPEVQVHNDHAMVRRRHLHVTAQLQIMPLSLGCALKIGLGEATKHMVDAAIGRMCVRLATQFEKSARLFELCTAHSCSQRVNQQADGSTAGKQEQGTRCGFLVRGGKFRTEAVQIASHKDYIDLRIPLPALDASA